MLRVDGTTMPIKNHYSCLFQILQLRTELQNAKTRGLRARVLTAITRENIPFCKEILEIVEVRHLDGIKGNFGVTDTDYIAISTPTEEQSIPNAVYSNVKEDINRQAICF